MTRFTLPAGLRSWLNWFFGAGEDVAAWAFSIFGMSVIFFVYALVSAGLHNTVVKYLFAVLFAAIWGAFRVRITDAANAADQQEKAEC